MRCLCPPGMGTLCWYGRSLPQDGLEGVGVVLSGLMRMVSVRV